MFDLGCFDFDGVVWGTSVDVGQFERGGVYATPEYAGEKFPQGMITHGSLLTGTEVSNSSSEPNVA